MITIYGINKIRKFKNPVVALGVFDGVHRGHEEILRAAVAGARLLRGTSIVLTFWPHPQGEKSLYSLAHRLRLMEELSIDVCVVVNFSSSFSSMRASDFVKNILVKKLSAKYIYIGRDFRFGKGASGSFDLLKALGERYGFKTRRFNIVKHNGKPISSTLIRRMISRGRIKEAEGLLGRPVSILGTVARGTSLGRIIGFPTANINPHHEVIPAEGIYAARVILGRNQLKGACYIGKRPTLRLRNKKTTVEVHILKFNENIYKKDLEIQFVKRIRQDKKFTSLSALSRQIRKDLIMVKKIFS